MTLVVIVLAGALGTGYFVYGKKDARASFMLAGAALCVYPIVISGFWRVLAVGLALALAPFVLEL
jgi:hypothetical protein